jgi:GNAT superfamily N-acetyltransferase
MSSTIFIRRAKTDDVSELSQLLRDSLKPEDKISLDSVLSQKIISSHWIGSAKLTYLAYINNSLVGSFNIEENMPQLESHIANVSFLILPEYVGTGLGRSMAQFALKETYDLGFLAIQFNLPTRVKNQTPSLSYRFDNNKEITLPTSINF